MGTVTRSNDSAKINTLDRVAGDWKPSKNAGTGTRGRKRLWIPRELSMASASESRFFHGFRSAVDFA
jgi:hypothetical protein